MAASPYTAVPQVSLAGCELAVAAGAAARSWSRLGFRAVGFLVGALLAIGGCLSWRRARLVSTTAQAGGDEPMLWQQEQAITAISWVGCFAVDDGSHNLDEGPLEYGYTTVACAKQCRDYVFMALQDSGRCACGNSYAQKPLYQQVEDEQCGSACSNEDGLSPARYCGTAKRNAVYRLLPPGIGQAPDETSELVGTWLFGSEQSKCFVTKTVGGMHLRFSVPLPKGQIASGILQLRGQWLQAELASDDGELVGTIRLRLTTLQGSLVSNFKYPAEVEWGKDTTAKKVQTTVSDGASSGAEAEGHFFQVAAAAGGPGSETSIASGESPSKEADVPAWKVITRNGLNVRSAKDISSPVLDVKQRGNMVRGRKEGIWVRLVDEPGFMMVSDMHGKAFLEAMTTAAAPSTRMPPSFDCEEGLAHQGAGWSQAKKAWCCEQVQVACETAMPSVAAATSSGTAAEHGEEAVHRQELAEQAVVDVWQVVTSHGLNVRSERDLSAEVLDTKSVGTIFRGKQEGRWVELADEPGFMMISSVDRVFLNKVTTATSTSTLIATHTTSTSPATTREATSTSTLSSTSTTSTRTTTTERVHMCTENCFVKLPSLRCLNWCKEGCHKITEKDTCLNSLDGRMALSLKGMKVHGQPCAWCENCHGGNKHGCQPFDWGLVNGSANATWKSLHYTIAHCKASTSTSTTTTPKPYVPTDYTPSIYCYSLMMPVGYEPLLLKEQLRRAVGIFQCDGHTVFSNDAIPLGLFNGTGPAVVTSTIPGSLTVPFGGKWNTALNTEVFIRVWRHVEKLGMFREFDWTVKTDPDTVFFAQRLRALLAVPPMSSIPVVAQSPTSCGNCTLQGHEEETCESRVKLLQSKGKRCSEALNLTSRPAPYDCGCTCNASSCVEGERFMAMYLVNCHFGLHGPIEVLSREAVTAFLGNIDRCQDIREKPYGEDKYLDQCLQRLGVRRVLEYKLLSEIACGGAPPNCGAPDVAFHPFKAVPSYMDCYRQAEGTGREEPDAAVQ